MVREGGVCNIFGSDGEAGMMELRKWRMLEGEWMENICVVEITLVGRAVKRLK